MSAPKLYAAIKYKPSSMKRQIMAVSHSIAALRRNHGGHIFEVTKKPMVGSQIGLNEYDVVGKEIEALVAIVGVATSGPAEPAFRATGEVGRLPHRRYCRKRVAA